DGAEHARRPHDLDRARHREPWDASELEAVDCGDGDVVRVAQGEDDLGQVALRKLDLEVPPARERGGLALRAVQPLLIRGEGGAQARLPARVDPPGRGPAGPG